MVDSPIATISGTTDPGATVTATPGSGAATHLPGTVDATGAFSVQVPAPLGTSTWNVVAKAPNRYASSTRTVTVNHTESEGAFKASAAPISYDELVKNPDALKGRRVYSRAKVFQYDSNTGPTALLVSVTVNQPGRFEFWDDNVLLKLPDPSLGTNIDNSDIIEYWGEVEGSYSYSTRIGGTNTVPSINVKYMNLIEKRED